MESKIFDGVICAILVLLQCCVGIGNVGFSLECTAMVAVKLVGVYFFFVPGSLFFLFQSMALSNQSYVQGVEHQLLMRSVRPVMQIWLKRKQTSQRK